MARYEWRGNVRQLRNAIDRATVLADDRLITIDDLPQEVSATSSAGQVVASMSGDDLASLERARILAVFEREGGNKARAARARGVHRRKLYRLIERFQIEPLPTGKSDHR